MKIALRAVVFCLLIGSAPAAGADSLEAGILAFEQRNFAAAQANFQPLADQAIAQARYYLAQMHLKGPGRQQNYQAAFDLFVEAGQQGHGLSQLSAAGMAALGLGGDRDLALANHLWLSSILLSDDAGDAKALAALRELSPLISNARKQQVGAAVGDAWQLTHGDLTCLA